MRIAIDIGGTNTRVGISKNGKSFDIVKKFKTPRTFPNGIKKIKMHLQQLHLGRNGQIAIAAPGRVSRAGGKIRRMPNLPGWSTISVNRLEQALDCGVLLLNDADAAGLAEALRGAGKGYAIVGFLTISTGIGGSRVIRGKLDAGLEPGHQVLFSGGRKCGAGHPGCFEAYGSGTGFYKTYGVRPENCKDKKIWAKHAQIIGRGTINIIRLWSPDIIVIGGGLSRAGALLFDPLRKYIRNNLKTAKFPVISPAKLGDNAGLYGCLEMLKRQG